MKDRKTIDKDGQLVTKAKIKRAESANLKGRATNKFHRNLTEKYSVMSASFKPQLEFVKMAKWFSLSYQQKYLLMKQRLGKILRSLYLIYLFDYLRYIFDYTKTYRKRKQFVNHFPNVVLPPAYLVYESFDMNYDNYYTGSHETAK